MDFLVKKYPGRIRNTLLVYYLIPVGLLMILAGGLLYKTAKDSLNEEMSQRLKSIAWSASHLVRSYHVQALKSFDPNGATYLYLLEQFRQLQKVNDVSSIYLFLDNNQSLLDTNTGIGPGALYSKNIIHQNEILKTKSGQAISSLTIHGNEDQRYKSAFAPVLNDGQVVAFVGVDGNANFFNSLINLTNGLLYFVLICIVLIFVVSTIISKKLVHPIEKLALYAKRMGEGDLSVKIQTDLNNEIGLLSSTLEDMRIKLHKRDQELQMMMQGIAHEVRNPLGGIELFLGLLKEKISDLAQNVFIEKISNEVQNIKVLTQEFLDFAKGVVLDVKKVDLEMFFNDLLYFVKSEQKIKNIHIDVQKDKNITFWFFDSEQIKRVLINFLNNAVDASKNDQTIILKYESSNEQLIISVIDQGCGIMPQDLNKLFSPFFTTKEKGSGLGLALSKKVVDAHQGTIEFRSQVGQGTTIRLILPMDPS